MADPASQQPLMSDTAKYPQLVDSEKGQKQDSYIAATGHKINKDEPVLFSKDADQVQVQAPQQSIGLTKEELEQYRDDPFWKKMRMDIAMFAAAIIIVVTSPRCPEKVSPHWWQIKVGYQVWTPMFQDSDGDGVGDIRGFIDRLDLLRRIGIQTIRPKPLLSIADNNQKPDEFDTYDVTDFKKIDKRLGTNEDFKELIDLAHDKDMYIIMDIPMSTTSILHPWFKTAIDPKAKKEEQEIYVMKPDSELTATDRDKYWEKVPGTTANLYYQHLMDEPTRPILNYKNQEVVDRMNDVFTFWLGEGLDGFYIGFPEYIMRNEQGTSPDWPNIYPILKDYRRTVNQYRNGTEEKEREFLLFTSVHDPSADVKEKLGTDVGLNFVINTEMVELNNKTCPNVAKCIRKTLGPVWEGHEQNNATSPMWEIGSPYQSRLATRLGSRAQSELMHMLLLTLPGALQVYYGDELGMVDNPKLEFPQRSPMQWTADDEEPNAGFSSKKVFINDDYETVNFDTQYYTPLTPIKMVKRLAKMRQRDAIFMDGDFMLGPEDAKNQHLLTFARFKRPIKKGSVIYAGALNFGSTEVDFKFSQSHLSTKPGPGSVVTITSNLAKKDEYWPRKKLDLEEETIKLSPEEGIVVKIEAP